MRFSKRGVRHNSLGAPFIDWRVFSTGTVTNLKKDVKFALEVLRADPRVESSEVILLGISEGTILGPIVANEDGNIAGLVLMSSVGQSMRDLIYFQLVERSLTTVSAHVDKNHDGQVSVEEAAMFPELSLPVGHMDVDGDGFASLMELKAVLMSQYNTAVKGMLSGVLKNWFQEHFSSPPNVENILSYQGPILLLHGEVDAQTPLSDAFLISNALQAVGRSDFELKTFPNLGHGFSPHKGNESVVPTVGPIAPSVVSEVSSWLSRTFSE